MLSFPSGARQYVSFTAESYVHRNVWDGNLFFQWKVARSKYASYAYDATWTYALALDKLLKEKPSRYQNLHGDDATT